MSWRPNADVWQKYKDAASGDDVLNQEDYLDRLFEAAADAMLDARVKWEQAHPVMLVDEKRFYLIPVEEIKSE